MATIAVIGAGQMGSGIAQTAAQYGYNVLLNDIDKAVAERAMTAFAAAEPCNPAALAYINRLSDYLFVLARALNAQHSGDVLWVPGKNR